MKIIIVAEGRYPDFVGGAETVIRYLSRGLVDRGHQVHTLTRKPRKDLPNYELVDGVHVWRYPGPPVGSRLYWLYPAFSFWEAHHRFAKLSGQVHFDAIISNHPFPALGVLSCSVSRNIKQIYVFHSSTEYEYLAAKNRIKSHINLFEKFIIRIINQVEGWALRKSQKIVTLSKYIRDQVANMHNEKAERIEVIPGGVDTNTFLPPESTEEIIQLRQRFKIPNTAFVIFVAKRLYGGMRLEDLIDAMEVLVNDGKENAVLLIAGDGPIKKDLEYRIMGKALRKWVWLLGEVPHANIRHYYQLANLFVSPREEPFGLVTLEALSCGLPVLSYPEGGTAEILNGLSEDLLFRDSKPEEMAEKIRYFSDHPDELYEIRNRCRKYVEENYTWAMFQKKIEKLFKDIKAIT